jgi:hypothetical protein
MSTYSRRGDLAGPVLLIGFGTLLLLINLGRIPVSLWGAISQLWPLALVVLGLDLLIPRRSVLGSIVVAALLLGVLFAGAGLALPAMSTPPSAVGGEAVEVPATGAAAVDVTLISGAGSMWVDDGAPGDALLSGTVNIPGGGQIEQSAATQGDTTTILVKTTGVVIIPIQFGGGGEVWDIGLAADPALRLSTQMGAGELRIDARGLNLDSIDASTGAGEVEVRVPAGASAVTMSAAVGMLTVRVPVGTPVRLEASSLAGSVDVPSGYERVGGAYVSPGFVAGNHIEIDASIVFGTISVIEE